MSKLQSDLVSQAVDDLLTFSQGGTITKNDVEVKGKKRKFMESIEIQVRVAAL
jgi:large subunit ribosomal protein L10Ae